MIRKPNLKLKHISPLTMGCVRTVVTVVSACLVSAALSCTSSHTPSPKPVDASATRVQAPQYAYFFDPTGVVSKVDLSSGKVEADQLLSPVADIVPREEVSRIDGCVMCDIQYDRRSGRAYLLVAMDARADSRSTKRFEIVSIQLPGFVSSQTLELPGRTETLPVILLSPEGDRLLVNYQPAGADSSTRILSIATSGLKVAGELYNASGGDKHSVALSTHAYFGNAETIYDDFSTVKMSGDTLNETKVAPNDFVRTDAPQFRSFAYLVPATNRPYIDLSYAGAARGIVLLAVNAGGTAPQGVMTLNLDTHELSTPIPVKAVSVSSAHFSPDATTIVVEQIQFAHEPGVASQEASRTGHLSVFHSGVSKPLQEIDTQALSGSKVQFLGISPDGDFALFIVARKRYLVQLRKGLITLLDDRVESQVLQWGQVIFADR